MSLRETARHGEVMVLHSILYGYAALAWSLAAVLSLRAIAVSDILTSEERRAGAIFNSMILVIAAGLTALAH